MLYLVSTPIGNLEDITLRALRILQEVDYILCEDTRKAKVLLKHYKIKGMLKSYHKFNEAKKLSFILKDLKEGKNIALLSDAGTPCICDPGLLLIKKCKNLSLAYTALPGCSSIINALVLSGLSDKKFQFMGFFPKKNAMIIKMIHQIALYPGISLAFVSPYNIEKVLSFFQKYYPNKEIFILREMTKKFEEIFKGTAKNIQKHFSKKNCIGEMVLAISGFEKPHQDLPLPDMVHYLQKIWLLSEKEAFDTCSKIKNVSKNEIYNKIKIKKIISRV